ncbi:hypothetical protein GCM10017620_04250 [Brevundimonas intermedia]|uniref:Uncharacterized protein n=2 Tax=Brevundimonas intermedia TaxID=74315 RepID=A0ABQ5T3W2_9CAUL|nr:hypothetical protein GCM10017620_04250 [Brevundimonas intermedia]
MRMRPPTWLPYLGPPLAGVGAGVVGAWLGGGFWVSLIAALVVGFAPIVAYRLWKRLHHRG